MSNLAKLRAAQLNHCPSCIRFYALHAQRHGETRERIQRLATWQRAPDFTPAEQAVLAWTEALTRFDHHSAVALGREIGALRTALRGYFTDAEVGALTVALRGPLTRCSMGSTGSMGSMRSTGWHSNAASFEPPSLDPSSPSNP